MANRPQASEDYIESNNIGSDTENQEGSSSGAQGDVTRRSSNQSQNGHHDSTQRLVYLGLYGFSMMSGMMGLMLLVLWISKFRKVNGVGFDNADQIGNFHPLLMYKFMIALNVYAVLVYRTHYSAPKLRLKWIHASVAGMNIVFASLGVYAMLKSHWMKGINNFYSLHSWIGAMTGMFYMSQFVAGFLAFVKPGMSQAQRAALMPLHRFSGIALLILAAMATLTGMMEMAIFDNKDGSYSNFGSLTFVVNAGGVSVILVTLISLYLLSSQRFMRPNLPEEEPLKR